MIFLEFLDSMVERCDHSSEQKKIRTSQGIEVTIFDDGDICHIQDILTGKGSYLASDTHEGFDRYWGGAQDSCVLLSVHEHSVDSEKPFIVLHFFDNEALAKKTASVYSNHHFIILARLNRSNVKGGLEVVVDHVGISHTLNDISWFDLANHLANHEYLSLEIYSKQKEFTTYDRMVIGEE